MKKCFFSVDKKKRQYIEKWLCSVPEYQSKKKIVKILYAVSMLLFAFARPISVKAKKDCGLPYTAREQECLILYDDGVEFLFHNAFSRYSESMDVYRIPIENINAVRYDPTYHMVTVIGQGELLSYDDYSTRRLNHQNSQRRFYSNSPYYILNAFDKEDDVIVLLSGMARNKSAK